MEPGPIAFSFAATRLSYCESVTRVEPLDPQARFRLNPTGEAERLVHDAFSRHRNSALDRLSELFGGFRFADLVQRTDNNTAALLSVNSEMMARLGLADEIDDLLVFHDVPFPRLSFAQGGTPGHQGPTGCYRPSSHPYLPTTGQLGRIAADIVTSSTMILNQVDRYVASVGDISRDLECCFGTQVGVNCYVGTEASDGFGAHWDTHDVVILQVEGSKFWEVFTPTDLSLTDGVKPSSHTSSEVAWSGIVEAGAALFIPRGWGHRTVGNAQPSTHLTFGVKRCSGLNVLSHFADSASDELANESNWSRRSRMTMVEPSAIERAVGSWRASVSLRSRGSLHLTAGYLSRTVASEHRLRARIPIGPVPPFVEGHQPPSPDGRPTVSLGIGQRLVTISADHSAMIAAFSEDDGFLVDDVKTLCPDRDRDCAVRTVRALLEGGVLDIWEPTAT